MGARISTSASPAVGDGPVDDDGNAAPGSSPPHGAAARRKREWQPPAIRTGHLFESNSLACGKNTPQLDQCLQNPLSS
jgi:hypothetical protein